MDVWKELVVNTPIAAAMWLLAREFLRHNASERALDRAQWSNHLTESVRGQTKVAEILDRLVDEVRDLRRGGE